VEEGQHRDPKEARRLAEERAAMLERQAQPLSGVIRSPYDEARREEEIANGRAQEERRLDEEGKKCR
jgi:hypothetical protein